MAPLRWKHHTLIQALLSRGPLEERELHAVFAGVTGKNPVSHKQLFNDCLLMINKELDFVQFELRACMNQYDGKIYYGFVNNVSDEQSKLGTKYSVPQIVFYKAIIESIALDGMNQGCISNIEALNIRLENQVQDGQAIQESQSCIPAAFKSFTISQKEKTLSELIRDRWLSSTSDGQIGLGVRSFLDLRSWFCNNDVVSCHVCNEAAIKAEQCPNEGCLVNIHHYCLKKFYKRKYGIMRVVPQAAKVCPGCGAEWHHPSVFIEKTGEEASATAEPVAVIDDAVNAPILKEKRTRKISIEESTSAASDSRCRIPVLRKKRLKLCKKGIEDAAPAPRAAGVRTRRSALR